MGRKLLRIKHTPSNLNKNYFNMNINYFIEQNKIIKTRNYYLFKNILLKN